MKVNINQPSSQKTNPQNDIKVQTQNSQTQNNTLSLDQLYQLLQQLQKQQNLQQQNVNNTNINNTDGKYIVKSSMKASHVALRIENMLLEGKKKLTMSALGFAIPILIDSVMLIRKDLYKKGITVKIEGMELFEETVRSINGYGKRSEKTISGLKITISI